MRVIRDNKELQGVKGVYKGSRASQENTRGYYTYTEGYSWLKGLLLVVTGFPGITSWFYLF